MPGLAHLPRYVRTLRNLKASQIAWRARREIRRRFLPPRTYAPPQSPVKADVSVLEQVRIFAARCNGRRSFAQGSVEELRTGVLRILNREISIRNGIPWALPDGTTLAKYTIQYMDFLRLLAEANADSPRHEDALLARSWFEQWIAHNTPVARPAWDPFPISCRILNWSVALSVFPELGDIALPWLIAQAGCLCDNLEHDVLANHLLKNAVALVVAGRVLGPEPNAGARFLAVGMPLLKREISEQILKDGGHYERSPMYHCHVFEDLLLVQAVSPTPVAEVDEAVVRMSDFLRRIVHPDGEIPLFGDAVTGTGLEPRALLSLANCDTDPPAEPCYSLCQSGFFVMTTQDCRARLIAKAGGPGPRYQPGHAHSDMLSYELSIDGRRLIVDSGVSEYENDDLRAYCRSTRAHNTVGVAGHEQLECWSKFRVGRVYAPTCVQWQSDGAACLLRAGHDGFAPYMHERIFQLLPEGYWLIIDRVTGPDAFDAESYIHFHPDVTITRDGGTWEVSLGNGGVRIVPVGVSTVETARGVLHPRQGWYCPRFGVTLAAPCLVLCAHGAGALHFGYAIVPLRAAAPGESELHAQFNKRVSQFK